LATTQSQHEPIAKTTEQPPSSSTPVVRMPRSDAAYLNNPPPPYPRLSRRMGEQGVVLLRVWVSEQGIPERVQMIRTSGSPRLDQSALETLPRWRFVPGQRDGQPHAMWVQVPIQFLLD
jgi:protein TonB